MYVIKTRGSYILELVYVASYSHSPKLTTELWIVMSPSKPNDKTMHQSFRIVSRKKQWWPKNNTYVDVVYCEERDRRIIDMDQWLL